MQNHPITMSAPRMKTNMRVAGNGSSPRGNELRDMRASLARPHEVQMKVIFMPGEFRAAEQR